MLSDPSSGSSLRSRLGCKRSLEIQSNHELASLRFDFSSFLGSIVDSQLCSTISPHRVC